MKTTMHHMVKFRLIDPETDQPIGEVVPADTRIAVWWDAHPSEEKVFKVVRVEDDSAPST